MEENCEVYFHSMKKKKTDWDEGFPAFLKIKGWAIVILVGLALLILICRYAVVIPYYAYQSLGIGWYGLIVGGIALLFIVNIFLGIIAAIFKLDENDIAQGEIWICVGIAVLCFFTWIIITQPG